MIVRTLFILYLVMSIFLLISNFPFGVFNLAFAGFIYYLAMRFDVALTAFYDSIQKGFDFQREQVRRSINIKSKLKFSTVVEYCGGISEEMQAGVYNLDIYEDALVVYINYLNKEIYSFFPLIIEINKIKGVNMCTFGDFSGVNNKYQFWHYQMLNEYEKVDHFKTPNYLTISLDNSEKSKIVFGTAVEKYHDVIRDYHLIDKTFDEDPAIRAMKIYDILSALTS